MECHVIVFTDLDKIDSRHARRRACVGMSHAKYDLYLLGEKTAIPDRMDLS
jgi:hypothetical protein